MKKIIFVLVLISILRIVVWKQLEEKNINVVQKPQEEPSPTMPTSKKEGLDFDFNGKTFHASWIKITNTKNISLYPNFKEKLSASEFKKQKNCENVTNAGFYDKNNNPLGLLIINGSVVSPKIESNFLNGIFSITQDKKVSISREISNQNIFLALQSGPLLYENGEPFTLKIVDDKESRRMVIAVNKESEIFFIAIYNQESPLQGPLLADLPRIMKILEEKINEKFLTALNLDGGTASAFYSEDTFLAELSSVGSFFCITQ